MKMKNMGIDKTTVDTNSVKFCHLEVLIINKNPIGTKKIKIGKRSQPRNFVNCNTPSKILFTCEVSENEVVSKCDEYAEILSNK